MPDAKRLIVNADDFGIHPSVNRAIILAHREGIVTSTTILAGGAAFFDSAEELKSCPDLGVGVHLCLVDQRSVLSPEQVPSLVDETGRFAKSYSVFIKRLVLGGIKLREVQLELEAQIARIRDLGLTITHLDSHQHLHLLPGISGMVAQIGRKFGIRGIRIPAEMPLPGSPTPSLLRRLQGGFINSLAEKRRREFRRQGFVFPEQFFGFSRGGNFLLADWRRLIPQLPAGATEVMVHPGGNTAELRASLGIGYHWGEEFQALTHPEVRLLLMQHRIELINYGNLI